MLDEVKYNNYIEILKHELIPAMGCTEPIALAYCARALVELLGSIPQKTNATICGNIIKNVKSVIVPKTNGLKGLEAAIAAGYYAKSLNNGFSVLETLDDSDSLKIMEYLKLENIKVMPSNKPYRLYIELEGYDISGNRAKVAIAGEHTNICHKEYNGNIILDKNFEEIQADAKLHQSLNVVDIIEFANTVDLKELKDILQRQINYNLAIAKEGLKSHYGAGIGRLLLDTYGNDTNVSARAYAAAASDARMSGCPLPVIILSGSGNQGITASMPIYVFAKNLNASNDAMLRALIVSDLITLDQKKEIGRLSAFCGATLAAIGAACGICYLKGGSIDLISQTIVNALGIISGMVCDGAKPSCAAKIAEAIDSALLGYYMALHNERFKSGEGLITSCVEATIENVGKMARLGMSQTDDEILKIMCTCKEE